MRHPAFLRAFVFLLVAIPTLAAAPPKPTPTPAPRLTGGFGKAPATEGAARRATEKKKLRITNESLVTEPDKGKVSTSEVKPPPTAKASESEAPAAEEGSAAAPATGEGGEAYWRGEARRLRERVGALRATIARLDDEVKKLESDFYSWDDGAYRDRVIKPAWDKAREELATARRELPVAEKDLAELPDRARRAGALPGWLRE